MSINDAVRSNAPKKQLSSLFSATRIGVSAAAASLLFVFYSVISIHGAQQHVFQFAFPKGAEGDVFRALGSRFCTQERISCRFIELDYDALFARELTQLKTFSEVNLSDTNTEADDVIAVDDPWLSRFRATNGLLILWPTDIGQSVQSFVGPALKIACDVDTCPNFIAVPVLGNVQTLAINSDFDQSPDSRTQSCPASATCNWANLIAGKGLNGKAKSNLILRGGNRNPLLTDFIALLWAVDPTSLDKRLQLSTPALTKNSIAAFRVFRDWVRQAPDSFMSIGDFDSQSLLFNDVAGYGVLWSNTAMRSVLDLGDISSPEEAPSMSHVNHLLLSTMPSGKAELGEWLLAVPNTKNKARLKVAKRFVAWITTVSPAEKPKAETTPLLWAALEKGNPPASKTIYQAELFKAKFGRKGEVIEESLEGASVRPRDENWDCIRQEISDQLTQFAINEADGGNRNGVEASEIAMPKRISLFIACIQDKQKKLGHSQYVCDPDENARISRDVQSCRDNPEQVTKKLRGYPDWATWFQP